MNKHLAIIGAGGHAHVVADAAISSREWSTCTFYDDHLTNDNPAIRWPVAGTVNELFSNNDIPADACVIGIGSNQVRLALYRTLVQKNWKIATIVHPFSSVATDCEIGPGTVVFAGAVVNTRAAIGAVCILNSRCSVDHDCVLANGVHISPGASLAGNVRVDEAAWVGIGSSIIEGTTIGARTLVGAGSAVVLDIEADMIAYGNPAKAQSASNKNEGK